MSEVSMTHGKPFMLLGLKAHVSTIVVEMEVGPSWMRCLTWCVYNQCLDRTGGKGVLKLYLPNFEVWHQL